MWRLHSPCAGNARGRSAGGGVSLGHDPTAVGMGTGQVRGCCQRYPPSTDSHSHRLLCPPSSQASQPCSRQLTPGLFLQPTHPLPPPPKAEKDTLMQTHPAGDHLGSPQTDWRCPPLGWGGMGVHRTPGLEEAAGFQCDSVLQPVDAQNLGNEDSGKDSVVGAGCPSLAPKTIPLVSVSSVAGLPTLQSEACKKWENKEGWS